MTNRFNASPFAVGVGVVLALALVLGTAGSGVPLVEETVGVAQDATGDVVAAVSIVGTSDGAATGGPVATASNRTTATPRPASSVAPPSGG